MEIFSNQVGSGHARATKKLQQSQWKIETDAQAVQLDAIQTQ